MPTSIKIGDKLSTVTSRKSPRTLQVATKHALTRVPTPMVLLLAGIITRCAVCLYLDPSNNDNHIGVIKYLVQNKTFPPLETNMLAFHPPLYYWMAAPLFALSGSDKVVQLLSLAFSIATLWVLYKIIYRTEMIALPRARLYSLLLACFLPQFVMFSLYVSNDSLTILLGCLTVLLASRYVRSPDWKQLTLLAMVAGLGLLTKATFLVFLPVLAAAVYLVKFQELRSRSRAVGAVLVFLTISGVLGSYKYVDNYRRYSKPTINGLDLPLVWVEGQKRSYRGLRSYLGFDLRRLVLSPKLSPATEGSYPLLLYGTFWYQHIPESNFLAGQISPYFYLGSAIYIVALVPTGIFLLGLLVLVWRLPDFLQAFDRQNAEHRGLMVSYIAAALLMANFALMAATIVRYHVWGLMQGRLLFPALAGGFAAFSVGFGILDKSVYGSRLLQSCIVILLALFGLYFFSEIAYLENITL
jgi:4-amino-4-deoxy-L-arabinose transferase-like glycosyltransferase